MAVEFSKNSNMLLVVSYNGEDERSQQARSSISVWDFLEGRRDVFCRTEIPVKVTDAKWNPNLSLPSDEFISISSDKYHYWRIKQGL
jgi:hypothetical protein